MVQTRTHQHNTGFLQTGCPSRRSIKEEEHNKVNVVNEIAV